MGCVAGAFYDAFLTAFRVQIADTCSLKEQSYRLRHQVYCIENEFEPRSPDGLERDRFDCRARHALLFHRDSDLAVGTVRLILPDPEGAPGSLPIHAVCPPDVLRAAGLPASHTAEISRFALSRARLRHLQDAARGEGDARRVLSLACLGLLSALRHVAVEHGVTHAVAVMEPSLRRRLGMIGVSLEPLGGPVQYHGLRVPCHTRLDRFDLGLQQDRPELWPVVCAEPPESDRFPALSAAA
jgi:N-acyl amino acid synthase of PEP-CTERM/exosortase system